MAALITKWRESDCLIDLFGIDAHSRISWVRSTHNETLGYVASLSESDRWKLFRATALGNGWRKVVEALPGDWAIGEFRLALIDTLILPSPWFARLDDDYHWHIRMPNGLRIVDHGKIEVYRRCRQQ